MFLGNMGMLFELIKMKFERRVSKTDCFQLLSLEQLLQFEFFGGESLLYYV